MRRSVRFDIPKQIYVNGIIERLVKVAARVKRDRAPLRISSMRHATFFALLFTAVSAIANPSGRLTVLVPINPGTLAGAGAQWTTTLWATNTGDLDAFLGCTHASNDDPCPVLKAHTTTALATPYFDLTHPGFFEGPFSGVIPNPASPDQVSFSLRATDSITAPQSAGTEIPLPRPSDFHNAKIALAQIPVNSHSRSRLRLYGITNGTATVRAIGITSNQELFRTVVALDGVDTLPTPINPLAPIPAIRFPSYAEIALPDSYGGSDEAVRIEITPGGDLKLWAFASVTDNVSQQFTIVSPSIFEYISISAL